MPNVLIVEDNRSLVDAYLSAFDRLNKTPGLQPFQCVVADLKAATADAIASQMRRGHFDFVILDCDLGFGSQGVLEGYTVLEKYSEAHFSLGAMPRILVMTNYLNQIERAYDPPNHNTLQVLSKFPQDNSRTADVAARILAIKDIAPPTHPEIFFPLGRPGAPGVTPYESGTFIKRYGSHWISGNLGTGQRCDLLKSVMRSPGQWVDLATLGKALRPGRPSSLTQKDLTAVCSNLRGALEEWFPAENWTDRLKTETPRGALWVPPK